MQDSAYQGPPPRDGWLSHHYGDRVHVLHDPLALRELAQLSRPQTVQPQLTQLVRALYGTLLRHVIARHWPSEQLAVPTRMAADEPRGVWHGQVAGAAPKVVVVDIARAGTVPSQTTFEALCEWFPDTYVRQDHIFMARLIDADGNVTGVRADTSKLGGSAAGAWVLFPDPMGATGTSMRHAIDTYKGLFGGPPARLFALHLIVTPEYLAHMAEHQPDVDIFALRLDRGMSAADVLQTAPGKRWAEERGLNQRAYIVPGAGGLGELLNNAEQ